MKRFPNTSCTKFIERAATIFMACGLLFGLSGCGIPQLRCPKPPMETTPESFFLPESFTGETGAENSAFVATSDFFNDPNLIGLIDQALVGNYELKILAEDIQIANNEVLRRRGSYLPFFGLGGGAGVEKPSFFTPKGAAEAQLTDARGGAFPNPLPDFMVAANVSWQIDIWRQLRNARDAQSLRFLGTIDGRNYVVTRLVAEIAENYYKLMALDKQLETLDRTIALQEESLKLTQARKEAARETEFAVQRFEAEVRKNQSQKFIIQQSIVETENRINFLAGRYPQPVARQNLDFIELQLHPLNVGVPSQLLQNRPDIREAERQLAAAGLDIRVARANFYPKLIITGQVGYEAFNTKYLFFTPESVVAGAAANLMAPLINKSAIRADYMNANAEQLQALYEYQRRILNAFTEVVNRVSKVQNYSGSIQLKKQQLSSLESAVAVSGSLFQNARVEYIDVLFAQRDRNEARMVLIETKQESLSAIINAYQALGGGWQRGPSFRPAPVIIPQPDIEPQPENAAQPQAANPPEAKPLEVIPIPPQK